LSVNTDGEIIRAQAELVWRVGVRNVYEVKLESGRSITATADHRLYSVHGWRPLDHLKPGDRLGVADPLRLSREENKRRALFREYVSKAIPAEGRIIFDRAQPLIDEIELQWNRIVSISPRGEQEVFDLTVPETSSWLADGIVSHNSGAIEQDADVVIFINRPEIYNPTPENEGIAEIILGKQRNGPIGTVQLSFQKSHTRFESLTRVRE
jgi:replicative DNA helicase